MFEREEISSLLSHSLPKIIGVGQDRRRGATEPRRPAGGAKENRGATKKKLEQFLDVVLHDFHDAGHLFRHVFVYADFSKATVDAVVGV